MAFTPPRVEVRVSHPVGGRTHLFLDSTPCHCVKVKAQVKESFGRFERLTLSR